MLQLQFGNGLMKIIRLNGTRIFCEVIEKSIVYLTPAKNAEDLIQRIRKAAATINRDMLGHVNQQLFQLLEIYKIKSHTVNKV